MTGASGAGTRPLFRTDAAFREIAADMQQDVLPHPELLFHNFRPGIVYLRGNDEEQRVDVAAHGEFADHDARFVRLAAADDVGEQSEPAQFAKEPQSRAALVFEYDGSADPLHFVAAADAVYARAAAVLVFCRGYFERGKVVVAVEFLRRGVHFGKFLRRGFDGDRIEQALLPAYISRKRFRVGSNAQGGFGKYVVFFFCHFHLLLSRWTVPAPHRL